MMGANYSFYVKSIAVCAPTFFGYIFSVLASVLLLFVDLFIVTWFDNNHSAYVVYCVERKDY